MIVDKSVRSAHNVLHFDVHIEKMEKLTIKKISDHVYCMPPAKPDRPSLAAIVGTSDVVMLDAGASAAHARQFLDQLNEHGIPAPTYVALTHWHWDHVFGAAEVGAQVVAQNQTAGKLLELAKRDWSDAGLERQISQDEGTAEGAGHIKEELPTPRTVCIAPPVIVFDDSLELRLGSVTCQIKHVGGDHATDSSVMFVLPDRVLFLGDCLYDAIYAPQRHYTMERLLPLLDTLETFDAAYYVEGHDAKVSTRAEFDLYTSKMREAAQLVQAIGADEGKVFAASEEKTGAPPDEDTAYFLRALIAGLAFKKDERPEKYF